jgi:hypothetical protein
MAAPKTKRPVRYPKRWPVALSERDVRAVKQAAEILDVTSSEFMRAAIREKFSRVIPAPAPMVKAKANEQRAPAAA